MTTLKPWVSLGRELLAETRIYRVFMQTFRSPRTGLENRYSVIDSPDWVNVVALDKLGNMIMIRQFRFGTGEITLEVPGGMVDPGEQPSLTAERELREETGYRCERLTNLGFIEPNPAILNNRAHMFLAEGCEQVGELALDEGEDIEVVPMPLAEVFERLHTGDICHALVAVALQRFELLRSGKLNLPTAGMADAAVTHSKPEN